MTTKRDTLHVIHVNQHIIKRNRKTGERGPPLTCKRKSGGPVTRAHQVSIMDEDGRAVARVVYSPDKPLPCGAVCWIETSLSIVREGDCP
jgi:hypothetical protein